MATIRIGEGVDALHFTQEPPAFLSHPGKVAWLRGFNHYVGSVQVGESPTLHSPYVQRMAHAAYLAGWDAAKQQHHAEVHRRQEA